MSKTKISEFSSDPALNTDIDGINIAEGCAPSGINNAIRELMAQLKDWQSGTSLDTFNTNYMVATAVDINGGAIDGAVIGANSAAAATFTTATATTFNATTVDSTSIEVTNLKAKDGTAAGSIADSTGVVTLASSVLTTTDINGGTIDGTAIGASSASTGAFTTLSASSTVTLSGGTANGVLYLNGSKVATSGSALTFDGTNFATTGNATATQFQATGGAPGFSTSNQATNAARAQFTNNGGTLFIGLDNSSGGLGGSYTVNYWYTGNYPHVWALNNAEQMRLTSTGLGIGTSSPSTKLQVVNTINTTYSSSNTLAGGVIGYIRNASTTNSTDATLRFDALGAASVAAASISGVHTGDGASALTFGTRTNASSDVAERLRIDSSGNVGIGTSSPTVASGTGVAIYNSSVARLTLRNATTGDSSTDGSGLFVSGSDFGIENREAGNIIFYNATERMRIDSSGNVGIGTSSPAAKFEIYNSAVNGSFVANTLSTWRIAQVRNDGTVNSNNAAGIAFVGRTDVQPAGIVGIQSTTGGGNASLAFLTVNGNITTESMRLDASGNVGIGTSSPVASLDVAGSKIRQAGITTAVKQASNASGAGIFISPYGDVPITGWIHAVETGTSKYLILACYKESSASIVTTTVVASSGLSVSATNSLGTVALTGFTDTNNVKMVAYVIGPTGAS